MQRENRRLPAIVTADIAGYSRLIGQHEEGTLRHMRAHQQRYALGPRKECAERRLAAILAANVVG